jgi:acetyltransferase-like isoleucine patch superfamily enzyme
MSFFSFGKIFLNRNPSLIRFVSFVFNFIIGKNHFRVHGKENKLEFSRSFLKKTQINIHGNNNKVIFGEKCYLINSLISIQGNNNNIQLGNMVFMTDGELYIEDDNGSFLIGDKTSICGHTHLACIEGKSISIGKNCLFSRDVVFRVGDSHSIIDMEGKRINPSQDIQIGNHVWFGNKTILTKGACIAENSIVATGAIVTKNFTQQNVILAGIPAQIIKENVNWDIKRI